MVIGRLTTENNGPTCTDLDSHVNTSCFGHNALVIDPNTRHVTCHPFKKGLGVAVDVPIVTAAVAYDQPHTGQTFIFIFHQALYFGEDMDYNLINGNQTRMNGIILNECPKTMSPFPPTDSTHSIFCHDDDLRVPLYMHGINSFFHSRRSTQAAYDQCPHIIMTAASPEWDFCNTGGENAGFIR
jgi:hypothetical protein